MSGSRVLVVSESLDMDPAALATLREVADVRLHDCRTRPELLAAAADAEILWVRIRHHVDAEVLAAAPGLRIVATPTTGLTHLDMRAIEGRGVEVFSLRGATDLLARVPATAEHTVLLLLASFRKLVPASVHAADGEWDRDLFRGRELAGSTVGLVGFGRLGRLVARRLAAFDVTLLAADPVTPAETHGVELVELDELLDRSDAVVVLASLDEGSRGVIDAAALARCRPHTVIVNTARGELIDESALVEALEAGRLAGAAVDVVSDEHALTPSRPLLELARRRPDLVLVTPHIGGATARSMATTERYLADRLADHLRV